MTDFVVDASVAVKWYVEEEGSAKAVRLLEDTCALHAPDFMRIEVENVLLSKMRRGEMSIAEAEDIRLAIRRVPIRWDSSPEMLDDAFRWAVLLHRTIYDSIYVSLAVRLGIPLVTADEKLRHAADAARTQLGRRSVISINDIL